jgi:MFS family permease
MHAEPVPARREMAALLSLTALAAYLQTIPGVISPFVARDFSLSGAGVAGLLGFTSLGTLATFAIARLADRHGRRVVLIACLALIAPLALASALSFGLRSYVLFQILLAAFYLTVLATTMVVITEELPDEARARGQAYYGLVFSLGGGPVLMLAPLLAEPAQRWRWLWALPALALLLLPWLRRNLPETRRFERAAASGSIARTHTRDLFRGPYRRRAIGLLLAWMLRSISVNTALTYLYYHSVSERKLAPAIASAILVIGGAAGIGGSVLGARLANLWGRRPTLAAFSLVCVAAGLAFYWVPNDGARATAIALGACFAVNQVCFNSYAVAERCIDTELFPTALRATYAGATRLAQAFAFVISNFGVSLLAGALGGMVPAITWICVATALPAVAIFLAVAPETSGRSLDETSLEGAPLA